MCQINIIIREKVTLHVILHQRSQFHRQSHHSIQVAWIERNDMFPILSQIRDQHLCMFICVHGI